jgi:hypothetical protein
VRRPAVTITGMLLAASLLAGCGSTSPTPGPGETPTPAPTPTTEASPTPAPTPTPVPTPLPTLPAVEPAAFGPGWTVAASSTNVGEEPGTKLNSTIGPTYSVIAVCTGEGAMTVDLRATGVSIKNVEGQPPGVDVESIPLDCPSVEPTATVFEFTAADYHGVTITPQVTAPDGVTYIVLIGTHG